VSVIPYGSDYDDDGNRLDAAEAYDRAHGDRDAPMPPDPREEGRAPDPLASISGLGDAGPELAAPVVPEFRGRNVSTEEAPQDGRQARPAPRAERALDVARARYTLRRRGLRPYALCDGKRYEFSSSGKKQLAADIRYAWRQKYPGEPPPSDQDLTRVIGDLERLALDTEPDRAEDRGQSGDLGPGAPSIASVVADDVSEDHGIGVVAARDDCPLPDGYRMPGDYLVRPDGGVWYLGGRWGPSRCAWAWLFPVAVYVDPDGAQWVELVWLDHGRWVSRLVRKAIAKSGRKLVAELGDAALPVTDSEARDAEKWLAAAEAVNAAVIPRQPVARQLGWQADSRTFVSGQDCPWRLEPRYPEQAAALAAHRPHGTLKGWQDAIGHAGCYRAVQIAVYEGLAPVLLGVLGVDSFTVDHHGRSSRGKTTAAMVALSCWADPSEEGDGLFSWQTTVIAAEKRLNLVNGLPVILDETRLVKDPGIVDTILYSVPKNHGKPRGGGHPNMIPWRTIVISTGEQPAVSFTTHQGASARVLSSSKAPFGSEGEQSRTAAEAVKAGVTANYGLAGSLFAEHVQAMLAEPGGAKKLRQRHAELTAQLRGETDMSGRRAPLMAVIALAAELAARWKITPYPLPDQRAWMDMYSGDGDPRDDRAEMALDVVREYIATHQDKMLGPGNGAYPPATGWIGHDAGEGPALLPEKIREELKRRGYELDAVLPGWLEMGALVTNDNQNSPHLINRRLGGRQAKQLIFKREVIAPDEGGEQ
jgi:Domain of unknown function (DUF927)